MKMNRITVRPEDDLQKIFDGITEPTEIFLKNGVYNQKLLLEKPDVTLKGESRESTILRYGDYAKKIHADGRPYNTFRTYTLNITGENARIENLTIENCAPSPRIGGQCVALSVICKRFSAMNADFKSTQDTVFLAPFPKDPIIKDSELVPPDWLNMDGDCLHAFKNCRIWGTVDFIFGCSEAYFKDCEIISLNSDNDGYIAAPAHPLAEEHGFTFINCNLKSEGAADGTVYLARPWRDFGKCTFINCRADKHIKPELFDKWNDTNRDKTARFSYYNLECAFKPAPVKWCKELDERQANEIIRECDAKFKDNMR